MITTPEEHVAQAIHDALGDAFTSPNVMDSNMEPANIVDVLQRCANGLGAIAEAICNLADAVREQGE